MISWMGGGGGGGQGPHMNTLNRSILGYLHVNGEGVVVAPVAAEALEVGPAYKIIHVCNNTYMYMYYASCYNCYRFSNTYNCG